MQANILLFYMPTTPGRGQYGQTIFAAFQIKRKEV